MDCEAKLSALEGVIKSLIEYSNLTPKKVKKGIKNGDLPKDTIVRTQDWYDGQIDGIKIVLKFLEFIKSLPND